MSLRVRQEVQEVLRLAQLSMEDFELEAKHLGLYKFKDDLATVSSYFSGRNMDAVVMHECVHRDVTALSSFGIFQKILADLLESNVLTQLNTALRKRLSESVEMCRRLHEGAAYYVMLLYIASTEGKASARRVLAQDMTPESIGFYASYASVFGPATEFDRGDFLVVSNAVVALASFCMGLPVFDMVPAGGVLEEDLRAMMKADVPDRRFEDVVKHLGQEGRARGYLEEARRVVDRLLRDAESEQKVAARVRRLTLLQVQMISVLHEYLAAGGGLPRTRWSVQEAVRKGNQWLESLRLIVGEKLGEKLVFAPVYIQDVDAALDLQFSTLSVTKNIVRVTAGEYSSVRNLFSVSRERGEAVLHLVQASMPGPAVVEKTGTSGEGLGRRLVVTSVDFTPNDRRFSMFRGGDPIGPGFSELPCAWHSDASSILRIMVEEPKEGTLWAFSPTAFGIVFRGGYKVLCEVDRVSYEVYGHSSTGKIVEYIEEERRRLGSGVIIECYSTPKGDRSLLMTLVNQPLVRAAFPLHGAQFGMIADSIHGKSGVAWPSQRLGKLKSFPDEEDAMAIHVFINILLPNLCLGL